MRHISSNLKRSMEPSKETERGELMQYFRQRLNSDRANDGYPPISMARMGKMLEKIPTKDLYYLKKVCDDSKHFSKKFWWEINPKNFEAGKLIVKNRNKKKWG
ncbi:MAG TPA: hypothetical protein VJK53_01320 [Candidatus Paceibacterota bacterium]